MTLEQLNAKLAEQNTKLSAALAASEDGSMTVEQKTEYDALEAEYNETLSKRDELQAADKRKEDQIARDLAASQIQPRQSPPAPVGELTSPRIEVKEKKFLCLGDQLQAIAYSTINGQDNEMLSWDQLSPATGSAQAGIPSDGGYLIQKDFVTELTNKMTEEATLPPVRTIPIGANSDGLKLTVVNETSRATGSRWGGVQVYWGAEADAATAKKPSFRVMELELKDLIGLAYATNRLLQDASALEAVFLQAFSEEMNFMKEDARINGTGAGQPKGILSTTGASATVSVAKETGQAASTIVYENIVNMWARMWGRSRRNAVWLINQDIEPQLMQMSLSVGTGGAPAYMPAGGLSGSPYGTLMGRSVIPSEYCATLGTVGDIVLWDPTQYVEIAKGGMSADQSVHVRFTTNENTFRFITRTDGQPLWNSALTPFKGSNTQSPQVTLAARA